MIEGVAEPVTDNAELAEVAAGFEDKYGSDWHFDVRDGAFFGDGGRALVFRVAPVTAFGFVKGAYGQTRFKFDSR